MRILRTLVLLTAPMAAVFALAQAKLPSTPVREVTDDYFGTTVTDPYR